jgi:2'-5' RNA ligase
MKIRRLHAPRRIFIGIKLADELADAFVDIQSALGDLPGKFIPPEDIHLTLVPPFETRDLPFVVGELRRALEEVPQFKLHFLELSWAPDRERPRLAWIECGATENLVALKKILLNTFGQKERIPFVPHMTILRLRGEDVGKSARRPIQRPVQFSMDVESVVLFESPHKGGSGYKVLAKVVLQPKNETPA